MACAGLPPNTARTASSALTPTAASGTPLANRVAAARPRSVSADDTTRSGFRLLGEVEGAYGGRLALIDSAQKTLDLQYYSIHYDSSTEALLDHLKAAAQRGVRVRMLIDDFNAAGKDAQVLRMDEVPGIEVRLFNPVGGPRSSQAGRIAGSLLDLQRIQQRMHNKALIADNALAIAGGRNLGNEYFGQDERSNFLDLDVLVAGPMVPALSQSFDRYWNDELAYPAATIWPTEKRAKLPAPVPQPTSDGPVEALNRTDAPPATAETQDTAKTGPRASKTSDQPVTAQSVPGAETVASQIRGGQLALTWAPAILMADKPSKIGPETPDDPEDSEETVVEGLVRLIEGARRDVLIISPYFVPGKDMMRAFASVRARGVRVRVLTNSLASNDAPLAHVGYARYRRELLSLGVELYELQANGPTNRRFLGSAPQSRASLHTKALTLDGRLMVVGSMNLDLRSSLQNTELGMVVRSQALSRQLQASIERALMDSYRVELVDGDKLRWHAPANDTDHPGAVYDTEPDASKGLKLLLQIIGPFAPEKML